MHTGTRLLLRDKARRQSHAPEDPRVEEPVGRSARRVWGQWCRDVSERTEPGMRRVHDGIRLPRAPDRDHGGPQLWRLRSRSRRLRPIPSPDHVLLAAWDRDGSAEGASGTARCDRVFLRACASRQHRRRDADGTPQRHGSRVCLRRRYEVVRRDGQVLHGEQLRIHDAGSDHDRR